MEKKRSREGKSAETSHKRARHGKDGTVSSTTKHRKRRAPTSPGSVRVPRDFVVVGGQRVYLNFIHAKRPQQAGRGPFLPHSAFAPNPFGVKESTLPARRSSRPGLNGGRAGGAEAEEEPPQPPVILELRNQIIESESDRAREGEADPDDSEFSIEEFTPPAAEAARRHNEKAAAAKTSHQALKRKKEEEKEEMKDQDEQHEREEELDDVNEDGSCAKQPKIGLPVPRQDHEQDRGRYGTAADQRKKRTSTSGGWTEARLGSADDARHVVQPPPTSPFAVRSGRTSPSSSSCVGSNGKDHRASSSSTFRVPSTARSKPSTSSTSTTSSSSSSSSTKPAHENGEGSASDDLAITSSFLASVDVLEKSATGRWNRPSPSPATPADDPNVSQPTHQAEEPDSQWVDSPFVLSTQALRAWTSTSARLPRDDDRHKRAQRGGRLPSRDNTSRSHSASYEFGHDHDDYDDDLTQLEHPTERLGPSSGPDDLHASPFIASSPSSSASCSSSPASSGLGV